MAAYKFLDAGGFKAGKNRYGSMLAGNPAFSFFFIETVGNANNNYFRDLSLDSSGNIYASGGDNSLSLVYSTDIMGINRYASTLTGSSEFTDVATDGSGNSYTLTGNNAIEIQKWNSSGTLQWQRKLDSASTEQAHAIGLDSSGSVYGVGRTEQSTSNGDFFIGKYNSSGTFQWQRRLAAFVSGRGAQFTDITGDAAGSVLVVGNGLNTDNWTEAILAKYDGSGNLTWQRAIQQTSRYDWFSSVATDSSNNVYVVGGIYDGGSTYTGHIWKWNSSGTLQWMRQISAVQTGGNNQKGVRVAVDPTGNVYWMTQNPSSPATKYIIKYNSSGTIQWQRSWNAAANTSTEVDIKVDNDFIFLVGRVTGLDGYIAKLPTDGSKTGTYTVGTYSFTYAASSLTEVAGTITPTTSTLSAATPTLTDSATTYTASTTSLPVTKVGI